MGNLILDAMMIGYLGTAGVADVWCNGGFETGDYTCWDAEADAHVVSGGSPEGTYHSEGTSGNYGALVGAISQTVDGSGIGKTLHFWWKKIFGAHFGGEPLITFETPEGMETFMPTGDYDTWYEVNEPFPATLTGSPVTIYFGAFIMGGSSIATICIDGTTFS